MGKTDEYRAKPMKPATRAGVETGCRSEEGQNKVSIDHAKAQPPRSACAASD
jgi:hypothetical protein